MERRKRRNRQREGATGLFAREAKRCRETGEEQLKHAKKEKGIGIKEIRMENESQDERKYT